MSAVTHHHVCSHPPSCPQSPTIMSAVMSHHHVRSYDPSCLQSPTIMLPAIMSAVTHHRVRSHPPSCLQSPTIMSAVTHHHVTGHHVRSYVRSHRSSYLQSPTIMSAVTGHHVTGHHVGLSPWTLTTSPFRGVWQRQDSAKGCGYCCSESQKHARVSQGRICSDNCTCCYTETTAAHQTSYLIQSQYTDTGPTSPSADPIAPGAWQGSRRNTNG